jgi:hypothetical protein
MSRAAGGAYTLPAGNPVVTGTIISSTWGNTTLADIATALTDSLSRSGLGGMTAVLLGTDGAVGAPAYSFTNEPTTGFYRVGAGDVRFSRLGVDNVKFALASLTAPAFIPTSSTVPTVGTYLPAANTLGFATNTTQWGSVNSIGNWVLNAPSSGPALTLNSTNATPVLQDSTNATGQYTKFTTSGVARGYIGVGSAIFVGAALTDFGVASEGALILATNAGAQRVVVGSAGNVTINAPSSGVPLTVNCAAATATQCTFSGTTTAYNIASWANTSGSMLIGVENSAGGGLASGTSAYSGVIGTNVSQALALMTNSASRLIIGSVGNVTINAPSSGAALTVSAFSTVHSTKIADSANASFNAGYLELPVNGQGTPYTAVLADSGKQLYYSAAGAATFTIPANGSVAYPVGTTLTFVNDASGATNMTIAITTDTLVLSPGGTTGSRTLAQFGRATACKVSATRWFISGTGLT